MVASVERRRDTEFLLVCERRGPDTGKLCPATHPIEEFAT
jgi:hypothetical protein